MAAGILLLKQVSRYATGAAVHCGRTKIEGKIFRDAFRFKSVQPTCRGQDVFSKYGARPSSAAATDLRPAVFKDFQHFDNLEAAAPEDGRAPVSF